MIVYVICTCSVALCFALVQIKRCDFCAPRLLAEVAVDDPVLRVDDVNRLHRALVHHGEHDRATHHVDQVHTQHVCRHITNALSHNTTNHRLIINYRAHTSLQAALDQLLWRELIDMKLIILEANRVCLVGMEYLQSFAKLEA